MYKLQTFLSKNSKNVIEIFLIITCFIASGAHVGVVRSGWRYESIRSAAPLRAPERTTPERRS